MRLLLLSFLLVATGAPCLASQPAQPTLRQGRSVAAPAKADVSASLGRVFGAMRGVGELARVAGSVR